MMKKMFMRRLIGDERGISSVEFAIVCSLFFMMVLGMIDFSRAMWEWNAASKATAAGVRYAVVNDMVSVKMRSFSGLGAGLESGQDIPIGTAGTEPVSCDNSGCEGNPDPATSYNSAAFIAIVDRMQIIYSRIQAENVVIDYVHCGPSLAGNTIGPDIDPCVTVRLRNLVFTFVTPGLAGIFTINLPGFNATLTGEDHNSS